MVLARRQASPEFMVEGLPKAGVTGGGLVRLRILAYEPASFWSDRS